MHLFADISSHGYGHLAIAAPVLNALGRRLPELRMTIRSGLPARRLRQRIAHPFEHIEVASDFGYRMINALEIDRPATAETYRRLHGEWERRVEDERMLLEILQPDHVLTDVSYLPLAGAARAGIPAAALCSLNWADLFEHFFGDEPWARPVHDQMLAAYRSAKAFLRTTPGMPMPALSNLIPVGTIAAIGQQRDLGLGGGVRTVLVALGGIDHRLPVEGWPSHPGLRWLVPQAWEVRHPAALPLESFGLSFTDLLASVDAVVTKPGYGTFTEAACNGTPALFQRRADWPEQDCLIEWLKAEGNCQEVAGADLETGNLLAGLETLWSRPARPAPSAPGAEEAAGFLYGALTGASSRSA